MFLRSILPHVIKAAPELLRQSAQWQSTMLLGATRSSYRTFPQVHPPWIIVFFRLTSQRSATQHFEDQGVHVSRSCNKKLGWLQRLVRWFALREGKTLSKSTSKTQGALLVFVFTRSSIAIQFTSHVLPPSSENDCSKRHESGLISEMTKRTRMARPLNGS